ncbi:biotin synthase BioB [Desulfoprunum benzoelyticum]|uniref:Biotin synthase n=1 Tax=Desulfoprunum benzoelyticum TaxID=1506996 RepID=A0A840UMT0_9BACT|nr:biotin synthase BioB [Desulfoprunum benzoelyticum]MBB5347577.1 biotin synthase [Desulfoprunum benzoelyticum]MBM9531105.1 biotin synthase BioB [Desulfoprunum benzoelyticum]
MVNVSEFVERIQANELLNKNEILPLITAPLDVICSGADRIRRHFNKDRFDICSIVNAKSGVCSEDCKFCAQSRRYATNTTYYELVDNDVLIQTAIYCHARGVRRFSIVTSGKRLSDNEIDRICHAVRQIKATTALGICVSIGLSTEDQLVQLKDAGVTRIHNNLEASENFFPKICTTHTFRQKVETILTAQRYGFEICSGGIIGLGETFEDRIDLAFAARELNVVSMPINILNPIPGTPFATKEKLSEEEVLRTIAMTRFIHPACVLRLAGGRALLADNGRRCFTSGANAVITGDMLTTSGSQVEDDIRMITSLGYSIEGEALR